MSEELTRTISDEYHYYLFGRALGLLAWVGIIALLKGVFCG
jgi:hypothetical protein